MPKKCDGSEKTVSQIDPELARLQRSCIAALNGNTISASLLQNDFLAISALQTEIEFCAVTYCACPNTPADTIEESVRFISSQFAHLNIAEVRESFRLTAAGKTDANLNTYYGQFSVRILGEMLQAYDDQRTQVYREMRARLQAEQDAAENEQRAEILKGRFGTLSEQFAALQSKNDKYQRWQDLPGWFCEKVVREDVGRFLVEEKGKIWVTAKYWAVNQLGLWRMDANNSFDDRRRFNAAYAVNQADPEAFPNELKKEAQDAYAKMLVFSKIAEYVQPEFEL